MTSWGVTKIQCQAARELQSWGSKDSWRPQTTVWEASLDWQLKARQWVRTPGRGGSCGHPPLQVTWKGGGGMRGESAGGLEGLKEERIFYRSLQKRSSLCSRRIKLSFDGYWPITAPASRKNVDDSRARADRELTASLPSFTYFNFFPYSTQNWNGLAFSDANYQHTVIKSDYINCSIKADLRHGTKSLP